jgi:hypothetical protein
MRCPMKGSFGSAAPNRGSPFRRGEKGGRFIVGGEHFFDFGAQLRIAVALGIEQFRAFVGR